MNLNVQLDGETEEQAIQYVNRFAINIPPTAFNLNIVNPSLNNQGYILNPVNPVSQNIVAYQPSMAVQSYFTLPTETDGNILHSLPVGVSVPVGLPVQAGFLQNNFVNTSIIIGNENCNSQDVLGNSPNHVDQDDDLKSNYLEKPIEELIGGSDGQDIGLNCAPSLSVENTIKKPCPLEMSIKAANIDIEFEKCEQETPILVGDGIRLTREKLTGENLPDSGNDTLHLSLSESAITPSLADVIAFEDVTKLKKTEITWDEGTVKPNTAGNNFQESLICEVEEVNDEEEEKGGGEDEDEDDDDEDDNPGSKKFSDSGETSEESDRLPLSVALKLKKLPNLKASSEEMSSYNDNDVKKKKKKKRKKGERSGGKSKARDKSKGKKNRKSVETSESEGEKWSESDDDVLNFKRIKNEFDYKCYFEPKISNKSLNASGEKPEENSTKFARVRSCCSKKECSKKIPIKDQMIAHKHFYELETNGQRDLYLATCIEHVQKTSKGCSSGKGVKEVGKIVENGNGITASSIRLEIENESNGNQKLSDEIQNAINESLRDCGVEIDEKSGSCLQATGTEEAQTSDKEEKNNWNYYIVVGGTKRKVCLQFLLKLLRITKGRIKQLQKKLLSGESNLCWTILETDEEEKFCTDGTPLLDEPDQKLEEIWMVAKSHLDTIEGEESENCTSIPRHRYLIKNSTREELFMDFKSFFNEKTGKETNLKFSVYKRFLDKRTTLSFLPKMNDSCAECEYSKRRKKSRSNLDSEEDFSSNTKKMKLTTGSKWRGGETQGRRNSNSGGSKNSDRKRGKIQRDGGRQTSAPSRGRDVWSLMLLHLETLPYKECASCTNKKKHRFFNSTFTTQGLFEDYRKYFLKETNSELGLGFIMYEKYFNRNCNYTIMDLDETTKRCPRCVSDQSKS